MNRIRLILGVVAVLVGVVWLLQGLDVGFMSGSPMTGELTWVIIGAVTAVVGVWLIWSARTGKSDT